MTSFIAALDTEVKITSNANDSRTVSIDQDDWWYPTQNTPAVDATDSVFLDRNEPQATFAMPVCKKLKPIRKDSVRVRLGGDKKVLLQQWECVVLDTDEHSVRCEMYDLTNEQNPIEFAEVLWSEFNDYDKPLLKEGAVFYWSIGHLRRETGQVKRFSEIRIRRMPKLSKAKKSEISQKVERLRGLFERNQ